MLCIIPTLMVLSFFINFRILQTGILQTGPKQFVENQKQNQDNTGSFGMKNLPKRLEFFCRNVFAETSLPKRLCRNVLFPLFVFELANLKFSFCKRLTEQIGNRKVSSQCVNDFMFGEFW